MSGSQLPYSPPRVIRMADLIDGIGYCTAGVSASGDYCSAGTVASGAASYCTNGTAAGDYCTNDGNTAALGACQAGDFPGLACAAGSGKV
jgi:hypothetical protein